MKISKTDPDIIVAGKACYTRRRLAEALGKSEQTVAAWRSRGFGPPFFSIGRRVLYPESGVLEWIEGRLVEPEKYHVKSWKRIKS